MRQDKTRNRDAIETNTQSHKRIRYLIPIPKMQYLKIIRISGIGRYKENANLPITQTYFKLRKYLQNMPYYMPTIRRYC